MSLLNAAASNSMFQQAMFTSVTGIDASAVGVGDVESGNGGGGSDSLWGSMMGGDNRQEENKNTGLAVTDDEFASIEKWANYLRYGMLVLMSLCSITAFYTIGGTGVDISTSFLAVYVFFFSSILCCFEVAWKMVIRYIVQNFGFLYNPIGKTIFLFFLSIMCFQLGVMGKIMFALLLISIGVLVFVNFRHPKYGQYLRMKHFYGKVNINRQQ